MSTQIPLSNDDRADEKRDGLHIVTPDIAYKRLFLVNVIFIGPANAGAGNWVLVDTGVKGAVGNMRHAIEERFGMHAPPAAIIQTHGHFDHVGGLEELAREWKVPVYAHPLEIPYLDGTSAYPPPDPSVGGGMMSLLSPLYPRGPVNVSEQLRALPEHG
ncbi:MAG: MBL fold metallo-hydrolase, partial [Bacteroidota bacterium]|nr:MBL fold metallo-hydrolase [Bacteroidota bacterium]